MGYFIIGCIVGGILATIAISCCVMAGNADKNNQNNT